MVKTYKPLPLTVVKQSILKTKDLEVTAQFRWITKYNQLMRCVHDLDAFTMFITLMSKLQISIYCKNIIDV